MGDASALIGWSGARWAWPADVWRRGSGGWAEEWGDDGSDGRGANTLLRPVNERRSAASRRAGRGMPISSIYFNLRARDAVDEETLETLETILLFFSFFRWLLLALLRVFFMLQHWNMCGRGE